MIYAREIFSIFRPRHRVVNRCGNDIYFEHILPTIWMDTLYSTLCHQFGGSNDYEMVDGPMVSLDFQDHI